MLDDSPPPGSNLPELSVSELAGGIKRTLEGAYGFVRVRAELGRVVIAKSGHGYFDLKDDRAVISGVMWKSGLSRLDFRPEEGLEVVVEGKVSTYPARSNSQLIVERMRPAGAGALMALLEERKKKLTAEGLFDPARKQDLPYLPTVIGVVTSPTGAVIRDILHRIEDRFPLHVLVWPVLVQGEKAAAQIAEGIEGFNAILPGGPVPRPDVLIVARGGGSIEDLWAFNEEVVVRAAAASEIPLVSAVGHETDTTLIDYASDVRAPTPTGAAEIVAPVRADLIFAVEDLGGRAKRAVVRGVQVKQSDLKAAAARLPRADALLRAAEQRFDLISGQLEAALRAQAQGAQARFAGVSARLRPEALQRDLRLRSEALETASLRIRAGARRVVPRLSDQLKALDERLTAASPLRSVNRKHDDLRRLSARLEPAMARALDRDKRRLESPSRLIESLSYKATLKRGFALVRSDDGGIVKRAAALEPGDAVTLQFSDGAAAASVQTTTSEPDARKPGPPKASKPIAAPKPGAGQSTDQGELF